MTDNDSDNIRRIKTNVVFAQNLCRYYNHRSKSTVKVYYFV